MLLCECLFIYLYPISDTSIHPSIHPCHRRGGEGGGQSFIQSKCSFYSVPTWGIDCSRRINLISTKFTSYEEEGAFSPFF